ncbi:SDR family oxidoreductase [Streptomyces sp. CBMA29]|uniref:SDR family oxidoreductase n=1 Tax=Streptomyces sp. CBMA29 TaxID=1896314 RepID=UPI001661EA55|nr:SDR family oxidoreductase [Streptomyces sp. CBMA29]MBD0738873.1 NmrA family transcriptional regulator [Streptomyces sp. CBMA29]
MTASILVTGGTGTLGRHVIPLLLEAGHKPRVLSRTAHASGDGVEYVTGDLLTGEGIDAAVDGIETVLHLAGDAKGDDKSTRALLTAASAAGVRHIVYISVVAADKVPLGYFKVKLAAERMVAESGLPWTTLRAAQFHEFAFTVIGKMAKLPVLPIPGVMRLQPVDSREVAARMVELTLGEPAGQVPDMVGPTVYTLTEAARGYLQAVGKRRPIMPVPMPGKAGRVYRDGENLTTEGATVGERTWEAFLAERAV